MSGEPDPGQRRSAALVRPRWVWGGLAVALVGLVVLALGIVLLSTPVSVVGAVVAVAGAAASVRGGVVYDARSGAGPAQEAEEVEQGDVHQGVDPDATVQDRGVRRDAVETTARTDAVLSARPTAEPALAPGAGWFLLGVAVVIVLTQPWLVGHTAVGRSSALRDGGLAIVVGLAGLRIAAGTGRQVLGVVVALLGGTGLLLGGLLAEHERTTLAVLEVVCGGLVVVAALLALARPRAEASVRSPDDAG
jgi:hypothetical protein